MSGSASIAWSLPFTLRVNFCAMVVCFPCLDGSVRSQRANPCTAVRITLRTPPDHTVVQPCGVENRVPGSKSPGTSDESPAAEQLPSQLMAAIAGIGIALLY